MTVKELRNKLFEVSNQDMDVDISELVLQLIKDSENKSDGICAVLKGVLEIIDTDSLLINLSSVLQV
jgi:hypothetical protein